MKLKLPAKINVFKKNNKNYIVIAVFAVFIAAFYGNALFNGFVLDDRVVIEENIYVQSLNYAPKVVTGCIWEYALGGCKGETLHYRPIHSLSYLLTYQISPEVWFFHLINLLYFLIAVYLVFVLIRSITKNFRISFLAALIFLIHPINNEVVNWISAVSELTLTIFILLTMIFYVRYRRTNSIQNFIYAALFFFIALLSKETASMVLLPILISIDLIIFKKKTKELMSSKELKKYALFIALLFVYFLMREAVLGGFGGLVHKGDYLGGFSFTERIYYFFWLFQRYLEKLLLPYPLIFLHELKEKKELLSFQFFALLSVFLAYITSIYFAIKKEKTVFAFSLIWILVLILPMLVFYNVVGENIFAERYLFVPSIGFSLIAACFLDHLWNKKRKATAIIMLIGIIAVSWSIIYPRNKTWKDNETFFRATLAQNPNASPIREYLANDLRRAGNKEAAKIEYEEIIRRNPEWAHVSHSYNNLGDYYRENEDLEKAEEYYQKAVNTADRINNYKPYNNLGAFYLENKKYLMSLPYFCKAMQISSEAIEAQNNFNRITSMIEGVPEESFVFLYQDFMQGGAFTASEEEGKILYRSKICIGSSCFYIFNPQMENEVMLPFLIMSKSFPSEIIKIKNYYLSPDSRTIILHIGKEHEDKSIDFMFPSCEGVYYTVTVGSDEEKK